MLNRPSSLIRIHDGGLLTLTDVFIMVVRGVVLVHSVKTNISHRGKVLVSAQKEVGKVEITYMLVFHFYGGVVSVVSQDKTHDSYFTLDQNHREKNLFVIVQHFFPL